MSGARIRAVGVVVPARDEEHHITHCLRSVTRALDRVRPDLQVAVTVVLDRCGDRTPDRVRALRGERPEISMLRVADLGAGRIATGGPTPGWAVTGSGVGALRHVGVRHVLTTLRHPIDSVWLLHTDADTTVEPDWVLAHLRHAAAGVRAVAGLAELAEPGALSAQVWQRYAAIVRDGIDGAEHRHVYGANLGVRADAYLATGGFPPDGPGEDHALWRKLRAAGHRLAQPTAVRVRTSARTRGRAAGGLADLLAGLTHGPPAPASAR